MRRTSCRARSRAALHQWLRDLAQQAPGLQRPPSDAGAAPARDGDPESSAGTRGVSEEPRMKPDNNGSFEMPLGDSDELIRRLRRLSWPAVPEDVRDRCWEQLSVRMGRA